MKTNSIATMVVACLLVSAPAAFCQYSGIFGTGVAISSDIGGSSTFNLYEITALGSPLLSPAVPGLGGVSLGAPSQVNTDNGSGISTWATGNIGQPSTGPSLGTFTQGVDTLTLNGGEVLTYKGGGGNVTAAYVEYKIDGGAFINYSLAFNQDNISSPGDQRWYSDGEGVNLLNGLSLGTHTLSVYFYDDNYPNTHDYVSNGAFNYSATITVVPEPTTSLLVASGLGMFALIRRRR